MPDSQIFNRAPFVMLDEVLDIDFGDRAHGSFRFEERQDEGVEVQSQCLNPPL
jgi:hypothetical protein